MPLSHTVSLGGGTNTGEGPGRERLQHSPCSLQPQEGLLTPDLPPWLPSPAVQLYPTRLSSHSPPMSHPACPHTFPTLTCAEK